MQRQEEMASFMTALNDLSNRVATLELHAPLLAQLCTELEDTLQQFKEGKYLK